MIKKIGIILFLVGAAFVGASCLIGETAFAATQENGQPCPPECVTDSLEIITYYPSPYGYYEELRGDKIIVGDSDNSYINETDLPPTGTITFEPKDESELSGRLSESAIYYDKTAHKFKYYNENSQWKDLGGGAGSATGVKNCDFIGTDADGNLICSRSSLYGKVHDTSQCEGSGGVVYQETNGVKHCKFAASACPSGWIHYPNWTATQNIQCSDCSTCATGSHTYRNMVAETCVYDGSRCPELSARCGYGSCRPFSQNICQSQIIEIGCY